MRSFLVILLVIFQAGQVVGQTQTGTPSGINNIPAGIWLQRGAQQHDSGAHEKAEASFREAIRLARRQNADTLLLQATKSMGNLLADGGRNVEALPFFQEALQLARLLKHRLEEGAILKDIGALHVAWKQLDQGLHYYEQAEKIGMSIPDYKLVADCFNNKGTVYEQQNNFGEALKVYRQANRYYRQVGNEEAQAMTLSNMAIVYKQQGNLSQSIDYNLQSLKLLRGKNDWMTAATLNNIGNAYGIAHDYEKALRYCGESIVLSRRIGAPEITYNALESLADAAATAGLHKEALEWHRAYSAAKDSFINTESTRQLAELQIKFETAEKERALLESQSLATRNASAVQRQRGIIWGGGIGIVLLSAVGILGFRNARLRRIRDVQTAHLEAIQARQQMQEERLRIGRELHDNIGSQLTLVASSLQAGNAAPERLQEAGALTLQAIRDLRSTVWFINHDSCTVEELVVKLREYLRPASGTGIQVRVTLLGTGASVLSSKASTHLLRIVQEGVNNALKYSGARCIDVLVDDRNTQTLQVDISDDGKGFYAAQHSEGYGLQNMRSRAGELNGSFALNTAPNQGTQILVTIPLSA